MTGDESTPSLADVATGVWVCSYYDSPHVVVFPTEVEALRHALANSMQVDFRKWGEQP